MAKRQPRKQPPARPTSRPRQSKRKTPAPVREGLPVQITARVSRETFQKVEALRDTLRADNSGILTRGVALIIKAFTPENRRFFNASLNRIGRFTK